MFTTKHETTLWERLTEREKLELRLDTVMNTVEEMCDEYVKKYNESNSTDKISFRITPFVEPVYNNPKCIMTVGLNFELKRAGVWNNVFSTRIGFARMEDLAPEKELESKLYLWKKLGAELVAFGISFVIVQQEHLVYESGALQQETLQGDSGGAKLGSKEQETEDNTSTSAGSL